MSLRRPHETAFAGCSRAVTATWPTRPAACALSELERRHRLHTAGLDVQGRALAMRRELQVQVGQAPQDERGHVLVAAGVGRPVLRLRDADVAHAVQEALDADAGLGPSKGSARAGVDPVPERHVLTGVGPVDAELVWPLEAPQISVG